MKRTKSILTMLAGFLLAFVMVFSVACKSDDGGNTNEGGPDYGITDSSKDDKSLDHISVRDYKESFNLGEAFSTGNIVVTATLIDYNVSDKFTVDETVDISKCVVDSSDYNSNRVGEYTIYVSYTRSNVTRTAYYTVEVTADEPAYGGIIVKIADGKSNSVSLTANSSTVTVGKDLVAVYMIGENGEPEAEPLHEDLYDADLYLGSTKIENNTTDKGGVYSLVVTLKADPTKQDFISVYVVNPVTKIEFTNAEEATLEQEASSNDVISGTLEFTVTYANGVTKKVKVGDAGLTTNIDTKTSGDNKTATITYVEVDASGASHEVTCTVTYTIKAKQQTGSVDYKVTYDVDSDDNTTGKWTTTWANGVEDSEGTITFNASALDGYKSGSKTSEDGTYSAEHAFEFKSNKNLIITVGDTASNVTINYFISHGTANDSTRTASVTKGGETVVSVTPVATDVAPGLYKMTVENATAGTYTLTANNTMRVYYVEIIYTVAGSGENTLPKTITATPDDLTASPDAGYTEAVEWGASGVLTVLAGCKVNTSKKTVDDATVNNRLQTAGAATATGKAIKIDLSGDEYEGLVVKVRVVFYVGSADTRYLQVLDSEGAEYTAGTKPTASRATGDQLDETVTLQGGSVYYLGGSNGINIYKVVITFEKA